MDKPEPLEASSLERFRGYLYLLADLQTKGRRRERVDASDLVQQTLVQAVCHFPDFRGGSEAELAAWLRQILNRQMANVIRDCRRQKRDVSRERSLELALEQSSSRLETFLAANEPSPSQRAQFNEQLLRVADALAALPDFQREAIVLHHLQGLTIEEVGRQLERSASAVAGLIKRGLRTLRLQLQDPDDSRGATAVGPAQKNANAGSDNLGQEVCDV